ncbi:MAG: class SAM-dependent methyltransferase [Flaviaesturariibacter sp.]|nr:class SAM-dependent methyltransferase [Flaviaesturariibacter sp.]
MSHNINDSFFDGQYKEVWRQTIPPGLTEAEVDFIVDVASLEAGQRVLDMMCGYGRHALELGKRGFHVAAVDNAAPYIEEINTQANQLSLSVKGIQAHIIEAELTETFDAVICMGNSFAFFPERDATVLLQRLANSLKTGGTLIINTWMIAEIAIRHFRDREWHPMKDFKYGIENRFLFQPTRIESVHTIIPAEGPVEELKAVDYIFTLSELEILLKKAGFALEAVYATPRKKKFALGDGRAYIVATKL